MKHFISMWDIDRDNIYKLITVTDQLKNDKVDYTGILNGKIMGMIFEKPSTRTRISFEVAMKQLGGDAIYLPTSTLQMSRGESIKDTAKVMSRYLDIIMARVYRHDTLVEFVKYSDIPVINGLSDLEHPVQILSDLYTIYEYFGRLNGLKIAFIGDGGNNVVHSLLIASAIMGIDISIGSPKKYWLDEKYLEKILEYARNTRTRIEFYEDPYEAVNGADIIYTDTFVSMGMEKEAEERRRVFLPKYQVTMDLIKSTGKNTIFMHCLPAHRGEEVTDEVIDSDISIVYDQAENRLHMQKALILWLFDVI